jgi:hypothetical protein
MEIGHRRRNYENKRAYKAVDWMRKKFITWGGTVAILFRQPINARIRRKDEPPPASLRYNWPTEMLSGYCGAPCEIVGVTFDGFYLVWIPDNNKTKWLDPKDLLSITLDFLVLG